MRTLLLALALLAPAAAHAQAPMAVSDANNAPFGDAIPIKPGVPFAPGRAGLFEPTTNGVATITLRSGAKVPIPLRAGEAYTIAFSAKALTFGSGTAGKFWNLP